MIYDLISRQNQELQGFLSNCQERVCFIDKKLQERVNTIYESKFTKWNNLRPSRGSNKQRSTNPFYKQPDNFNSKKTKSISIPNRVRGRNATKKSIEFRRHSSLFK